MRASCGRSKASRCEQIVIGAFIGATNSTSLNFAINGNNNVNKIARGNTNIFRD